MIIIRNRVEYRIMKPSMLYTQRKLNDVYVEKELLL